MTVLTGGNGSEEARAGELHRDTEHVSCAQGQGTCELSSSSGTRKHLPRMTVFGGVIQSRRSSACQRLCGNYRVWHRRNCQQSGSGACPPQNSSTESTDFSHVAR